ncbi:hypothetical protein NQ318_021484, partial [Aromia moschata]
MWVSYKKQTVLFYLFSDGWQPKCMDSRRDFSVLGKFICHRIWLRAHKENRSLKPLGSSIVSNPTLTEDRSLFKVDISPSLAEANNMERSFLFFTHHSSIIGCDADDLQTVRPLSRVLTNGTPFAFATLVVTQCCSFIESGLIKALGKLKR